MKFKDFLKYDEIEEIHGLKFDIDEVVPTVRLEEINEKSVVFIYKRINGVPNIDIANVKVKPALIVAEQDFRNLKDSFPTIIVKSARRAFAFACSLQYPIDFDKIKIIGVTGTNGKTTTATLIYRTLLALNQKVGFIGTGTVLCCGESLADSSYSMTTPDPDLLFKYIYEMQEFGCKYVVMEVSSHSLALGKVKPINFDIGIFTNLSEEHLDFHKYIDDYYKAKLSLFDKCKVGIFNLDSKFSKNAYFDVACEKISVGIIDKGDVYATDIEDLKFSGSRFYYRENGRIFGVNLKLIGLFNIYNALMAIKCLIVLGFKPCEIKDAMQNIENIEGRCELIRGDINCIIDYAHTPFAMENLLKTLVKAKDYKSKLTVVFGCGGDRDREKRPKMGEIAAKYGDNVIITKDNLRNESFDSIVSDILSGIKNKKCMVIENREKAIRYAILHADIGDTVAFVGKGREKYMIENGKYIDYDEKQTILSILNERK